MLKRVPGERKQGNQEPRPRGRQGQREARTDKQVRHEPLEAAKPNAHVDWASYIASRLADFQRRR